MGHSLLYLLRRPVELPEPPWPPHATDCRLPRPLLRLWLRGQRRHLLRRRLVSSAKLIPGLSCNTHDPHRSSSSNTGYVTVDSSPFTTGSFVDNGNTNNGW